ncbi:MAG: DUF1499 domain-containing protein [Granulosicoccus sp.]
MKLAVAIGILILIPIALRLAMPTLTKASAATGVVSLAGANQLGDCPDKPNCQCSEASSESQRVDRLPVANGADDAISRIAAFLQSQPGAAVVDQSQRYLHSTFTTSLMGYVDDVEFLLSDDDQSVQIRSASRLGYSDMGANAKRVQNLRQGLASVL